MALDVLLLVPCGDLKKLIKFEGAQSNSPPPLQHPTKMAYLNDIRPFTQGLVAYDPELQLYRFLRPMQNRWRVDHYLVDVIRNGSRRFYGYEDLFAVVDDTGFIERFSHITDQNLQLSVADPTIGGEGLPVGFIRPLGPGIDPGEQDRIFREDRDRRLVIAAAPPPGPPPPPAAGAALAAGAESQNRQRAEGQPALAALAAWPAEGGVDVWSLLQNNAREPHQDTFEEGLTDDARGLLETLRDLLAARQEPARPPPINTQMPLLRWPLHAWGGEDNIPNLYAPRAADRRAPALVAEKPLARVSEAVLEKAIREKESCPISMEELTKENATCVAPCYHTFEKESIRTWVQDHGTCPTCRQICCL